MKNVKINFNNSNGKIKPLHGVNNGPTSGFWVGECDTSKYFIEAGIPYSRLHDTFGAYGGSHLVDVPNIFKDFNADPENPDNYDFELTDRLLEMIDKCGTKIVYRLGCTIEHNEKKYNTYPPKDYKKWAKICAGIIRHYNYGWANGMELGVEYWEIWNEPEAYGKMWFGDMQQFTEFYAVVAAYLKKEFPECKIGGYGSIGFYQVTNNNEPYLNKEPYLSLIPNMKRLFNYIKQDETKAPLDFFSWHIYSDEPKKYYIHAKAARDLLNEYGFYDTESILDEWNITDFVAMRGLEGASHVAAVMCELQRSLVDKAMYYDAQGSAKYCGLFDFVTCKPLKAFYSLKTFNKLYKLGTWVKTSCKSNNVFMCAAKNEEEAGIMLTNYRGHDETIYIEIDGLTKNNDVEISYYITDENNTEEIKKKEYFSGDRFGIYVDITKNSVVYVEIKKLPKRLSK